MARLDGTQNSNQNSKQTIPNNVNIAGDYSANGLDIEPNEPYVSMEELRSNGNGGIQFEDELGADSRRADRALDGEKSAQDFATRESLKSATGPSTLGQEAGKRLVNPVNEGIAGNNTDWPVDE